MKKSLKDIFNSKNISPSYTRTRIYSYLEDNMFHPTVEDIYTSLKEDLPTLSKTTVYNVLKLFIEKSLVKAVNMQSNETRYEIYEHDHSHFKCSSCGAIYDIPQIETSYDLKGIGNFKVINEEVNLIGLCPKCQ